MFCHFLRWCGGCVGRKQIYRRGDYDALGGWDEILCTHVVLHG